MNHESTSPGHPQYWINRYANGDTEWDKGAPSPGLVDFLQTQRLPPGRVVVPGCGYGHDVRALARAGFQAVGVDVAPAAVERARQQPLAGAEFVCANFFDLPGEFDGVFEHTFFCAIDPSLRERYVETVRRLLRPRGWLLGVFYNIQPDDGPPFGTTRQELFDRFAGAFDLEFESVPPSYPTRTGKELLMLWRLR